MMMKSLHRWALYPLTRPDQIIVTRHPRLRRIVHTEESPFKTTSILLSILAHIFENLAGGLFCRLTQLLLSLHVVPDRLNNIEIRALWDRYYSSRTPCFLCDFGIFFFVCLFVFWCFLAVCLGSLCCCRMNLRPIMHL